MPSARKSLPQSCARAGPGGYQQPQSARHPRSFILQTVHIMHVCIFLGMCRDNVPCFFPLEYRWGPRFPNPPIAQHEDNHTSDDACTTGGCHVANQTIARACMYMYVTEEQPIYC